MKSANAKSKIITVSFLIKDITADPDFFKQTRKVSDPEKIKILTTKKYYSEKGILESFIEKERLILQWYPKTVNQKAEALHLEAQEFAKSKHYDKAIELWKKAIQINSEDAEYLYKIGLTYFEIKKYEESIHYLEKSINTCPINYRANLLLGINWMKLRKFDKAENYVVESNRLNRSNILTYLNLGAIFSIKRNYNKAIQMFNQVIQFSPNESRAYLGLARIYNMLNDVETSNTYFKKVIELSPGTKLADFAKRSIKVTDNQLTDVDKPQSREECLAKGIGHFLSGNYQISKQLYKEYLLSQPSDDYTWYLLGEANLRLGKIEESSDCFKRAIRLNPKRGLYYKSLGISLHFLDNSKDVIEIIKKSASLGKKDALLLTIQGIHFLRLRNLNEAEKSFNEAIQMNQNNPLASFNLALTLIQKDENEKAISLLESIQEYEYHVPIKEKALKLLKNIEI
jgi:tetratricopeptide (TPR) repeat protein